MPPAATIYRVTVTEVNVSPRLALETTSRREAEGRTLEEVARCLSFGNRALIEMYVYVGTLEGELFRRVTTGWSKE